MKTKLESGFDEPLPVAGHTPGVFELMANFKSYDIHEWLDTASPAEARALFAAGAKLEQDNATLLRQVAQLRSGGVN